jgi:hypothetical protein
MENQSFERLEKRIENLEYRVKVLSEIADFENHPFIYTVLEANLTEAQVNAVFDLMDQEMEIIKGGKKIELLKLENGIFELVPEQKGNYHFVKDIICTLKDEGGWVEVYNYLKESGLDV